MASIWAEPQVEQYIRALTLLDRQLLPLAVAHALNAPADAIAKEARRNARRRLIIRTQYTINSIRQDRYARGSNIERMYSRVGSLSDYLWKQDDGHTERADNSRIPIPTLTARGGSERNRIRRKYAMDQLGDLGGGSNMFIGRPRGERWQGMPLGIYERARKNKVLVLIRNLEESVVQIPPTHWYSDASRKYATAQFIRSRFIREADRMITQRLGGPGV